MTVDLEPKELTQRQKRAIKAIERALAQAAKAGVAICGMDDSLLAYRADQFDELAQEGLAAYDVQLALRGDEQGDEIEDHGVYRDSGGW